MKMKAELKDTLSEMRLTIAIMKKQIGRLEEFMGIPTIDQHPTIEDYREIVENKKRQ